MRKVGMAVALLASAFVVPVAGSQAVQADGPGVGSPWVVSVGDSYISGEGGRWAGNSNNSSSSVDAGGPSAYHDNTSATAEQIVRCHRSTAAEIHIGGGINSLNLACSGAKTSTFTSSDAPDWCAMFAGSVSARVTVSTGELPTLFTFSV